MRVRKTGEGKNRLKNSLLAIADQIVVSAGTFLSVMMVCRNCSNADFGIFILAWTIIQFLRTVQERMIAAPYLVFAFRPGFERKSYRGSSITHQAFFAVLSSCIALVVSIAAWILGYGFFWFGVSLAVALLFNLARDEMRAISYTDFAFLRLLILDVTVVATQLLGLLLLSWFGMFSLISANLMIGFGCISPFAVWLWLTKSKFSFESNAIVADWYHNWTYSRWLVGSRVLGIAPTIFVPWLIALYEGEEGTGVFGVCGSLVGVSLMFVTGINNLFQPRTVLELQRNGIRGMLTTIAESIVVICIGLVCLSTLFLFYGGDLLAIFGSQYTPFGFLTFLLSTSTLVVSVSTMFANGLAALKMSRDFFWGEVSCCIVSIVSAIVLVPSHGLNGAAYATILGGFAATVVIGMTLARGVRLYDLHSENRTVEAGSPSMKSK